MDGRCIFNLAENSIIKPCKAIRHLACTVTVSLQYTVYSTIGIYETVSQVIGWLATPASVKTRPDTAEEI